MADKFIKLIKEVYKRWKRAQPAEAHPDVEELACFAQNLLDKAQTRRIKKHLVVCDECAQALAVHLEIKDAPLEDVPAELAGRVKFPAAQDGPGPWQITLRLAERSLEIINATGDVLMGQELIPVPLLRSRSIKEFKDEVTILREFGDVRIEARIIKRQGKSFDLVICAKNKATGKAIKDMRVTLARDDLELESYLTDAGMVTFEHVLLGKYTVELYSDAKFASIVLDIKI